MTRVRGLLAALILAAGAAASAQFIPGMKMPSLWYNPFIVMDPGVQQELKISKPVADKIQAKITEGSMKLLPAMGEMMKAAMSGKTPSPEETEKAMPAITKVFAQLQADCIANLNPAQRERLHELTLQAFGPKSLLDAKIGKSVGLTGAQAQRLQSELQTVSVSQMGGAKKMLQSSGSNAAGARATAQSTMSKSRQAANAILDKVLTPKQRAKWRALQGKPFTFSPMASMMSGG